MNSDLSSTVLVQTHDLQLTPRKLKQSSMSNLNQPSKSEIVHYGRKPKQKQQSSAHKGSFGRFRKALCKWKSCRSSESTKCTLLKAHQDMIASLSMATHNNMQLVQQLCIIDNQLKDSEIVLKDTKSEFDNKQGKLQSLTDRFNELRELKFESLQKIQDLQIMNQELKDKVLHFDKETSQLSAKVMQETNGYKSAEDKICDIKLGAEERRKSFEEKQEEINSTLELLRRKCSKLKNLSQQKKKNIQKLERERSHLKALVKSKTSEYDQEFQKFLIEINELREEKENIIKALINEDFLAMQAVEYFNKFDPTAEPSPHEPSAAAASPRSLTPAKSDSDIRLINQWVATEKLFQKKNKIFKSLEEKIQHRETSESAEELSSDDDATECSEITTDEADSILDLLSDTILSE